jgi:hypothetical protein
VAGHTATVAESLASAILRAGRLANTEQELVLHVEEALEPVLDELGIPHHAEYEKTFIQGRADAVYGSVIIEYEAPGKLGRAAGREESFRQARQYMRERAEVESPGAPEEVLPKLVGVVLDGHDIGFVLWRAGSAQDEELPDLSRYRTQLTLETEEGIAGRSFLSCSSVEGWMGRSLSLSLWNRVPRRP